MPEVSYGCSSRWLTVMQLNETSRSTPEALRLLLERNNIEARPVWKPMHLQPVFAVSPVWTMQGMRLGASDRGLQGVEQSAVGARLQESGSIAEIFFRTGLCLPSGTAMTADDVARVCEVVRRVLQ